MWQGPIVANTCTHSTPHSTVASILSLPLTSTLPPVETLTLTQTQTLPDMSLHRAQLKQDDLWSKWMDVAFSKLDSNGDGYISLGEIVDTVPGSDDANDIDNHLIAVSQAGLNPPARPLGGHDIQAVALPSHLRTDAEQ